MEYTPGPWWVDGGRVFAEGPIFDYVLAKFRSPATRSDRSLVASAPELYEALVMVRDADEDCHRDGLQTIPQAARAKIDAAIAKAESAT